MSATSKKIAVIGAGTTGLAAVKECLEAGLSVQCFERGTDIGGQWVYTPDAKPDVHSSIYNGCILNSSRDTSAFSDFPLDPARYPHYFSHRLQLQYLNEYVDHFKLREHIRFQTEVVECRPGEEGEGGWTLCVRRGEGKEVEELKFDALMVAPGALTKPKIPELKGRDQFGGTFMHSHYYRTPGPFEGKRVAVVGFGSSAADIASEVAPQAKELHLITRRGGWVLPRFIFGKPVEAWNDRATQVWLPRKVANFLDTKLIHLIQGKLPPSLAPKHKLLEQNTTIRGDFLEKVSTGIITPHRASLESLSEGQIHLSDGVSLDVDVVICCTGYDMTCVPCVPKDAIASRDAPSPHVDLYKQIVSPYYNDLYVLGLLELFGPHAPAAEAQARFVAGMASGKIERPSKEKMLEGIRKERAWKAKTFINSDRHILTQLPVMYIDDLLKPLGATPTAGRLLSMVFKMNPIAAIKVFWAVYFSPVSSAQWRLLGVGKKETLARATVLRVAAGKDELSKEEKASQS